MNICMFQEFASQEICWVQLMGHPTDPYEQSELFPHRKRTLFDHLLHVLSAKEMVINSILGQVRPGYRWSPIVPNPCSIHQAWIHTEFGIGRIGRIGPIGRIGRIGGAKCLLQIAVVPEWCVIPPARSTFPTHHDLGSGNFRNAKVS